VTLTGHAHTHSARGAALASVGVATGLTLLKAGAAWATGSVAVLGSLADSGLDLVASLITLGAVAWAMRSRHSRNRC